MTANNRLSSVLLWSVISAAFIGPGTVTTAASAGALFKLDLLWAVVFSTIACIVLQEVSARLAIVSGLPMGKAMIQRYGERKGAWLNFFLGGPVILGCAAYQAGNIVGAVSGLQLMTSATIFTLTPLLALVVALILWTDRRQTIGWLMTFLVAIMGVAFAALAFNRPPEFTEVVRSSLVPRIPPGSELLALGLVGTTIVPYNVFLGSGVSKGQTVPLMRVGLTISVIIGGLITAFILVAGTSVSSFRDFRELSDALHAALGPVGAWALGTGLFAAGFSSAITSPYAASMIASTVFGWGKAAQRWTWAVVLLTGFLVGMSGLKPIPVILLVQALNGLVLPLLTAFLILLINDEGLINREHRPSVYYNVVLLLIFACVMVLGLHSIDKSVSSWLDAPQGHYPVIMAITFLFTGTLVFRVFRHRS
ncbi:MAG: divalent metal cation transporter [Cyclobacteriaceae bacterium]|nr:divalent metal cation transporter [Cyclobacteriaceae bacterium]